MICAACGEEQPLQATACGVCGGEPLLGSYRLDAVVGQGGTGTLYRAAHLPDGAAAAIKELRLRRLDGRKGLELFEREVRVLQQLDHPMIPAYRDHLVRGVGKHRALFLITDFVEGESLEVERARRRYDEAEVLAILLSICDVLAYLHRLNPPVIHRDVKPANVMRRPGGGLALVDFGAVRDVLRGTMGGSTVAGTFGYMAPEQFMGEASPATDVYGLGATAVARLSREDPAKLMDYRRRFQWEKRVRVRPAFAALLRQMLAAEPGDRPRDAGVLANRLRALARSPATPRTVLQPDPIAHLRAPAVGVVEAPALEVPLDVSHLPAPRPRATSARRERQRAARGAYVVSAMGVAGLFVGLGVVTALVVASAPVIEAPVVATTEMVIAPPTPAPPAAPSVPASLGGVASTAEPKAWLEDGELVLQVPVDESAIVVDEGRRRLAGRWLVRWTAPLSEEMKARYEAPREAHTHQLLLSTGVRVPEGSVDWLGAPVTARHFIEGSSHGFPREMPLSGLELQGRWSGDVFELSVRGLDESLGLTSERSLELMGEWGPVPEGLYPVPPHLIERPLTELFVYPGVDYTAVIDQIGWEQMDSVDYPVAARRAGLEGDCELSLFRDPFGNITGRRVSGCAGALRDAVMEASADWVMDRDAIGPAGYVRLVYPITFRLSGEMASLR